MTDKIFNEKYKTQIDTILGKNNWYFEQHGLQSNKKDPTITWEYDFWSEKVTTGTFKLKLNNGAEVASFRIIQMANCCGIAVSTQACVNEKFRKLGLGRILNNLRIDLARSFGYGILLCTYCLKNTAQDKILKSNDWLNVYSFTNPRTNNDIAISVYNLK